MKVLVAVGRTVECADPVLAVASFPWPSTATFTVLTVSEAVGVPPMVELVPGAADVSDVQASNDVAERTASAGAARLKERSLQAVGVSRRGDPDTVIVDYGSEWDADLIVVGSCEKSRIERFVLEACPKASSNMRRAQCSL